MSIGFDYDGTITKNPYLFSQLIKSLQLSEHKIYIISGTREALRHELELELIEYDIMLDSNFIILKPEPGDIDAVTEWKYDMIDKLKIRCFFENRAHSAKKINELCTTFLIQ